jgi:hypothetical protein
LMPTLCTAAASLPYIVAPGITSDIHPLRRVDMIRGALVFGSVITLVASYAVLVLFRPPTISLRALILPTLVVFLLSVLYTLAITVASAGMLGPISVHYWYSLAASLCVNISFVILFGVNLHCTIVRRRLPDRPQIYAYMAVAAATPGTFLGITLTNILPQQELPKSRADFAVSMLGNFSSGCAFFLVSSALIGYAVGVLYTRENGRFRIALTAALLATAAWTYFELQYQLFANVYLIVLLLAIGRFFLQNIAQTALFQDAHDADG